MHLSRYTSFFFGATYWLIYKIRFLHNGNSPFPGILWLCWYVFNYCFFWNSKELVWYDSEKSFPGGAIVVKKTPGSGKSPEEENGNPLQYSCLEPHEFWKIRGNDYIGRKTFPLPTWVQQLGACMYLARDINKNFQTFKLDLEKAEEPEIKLPTSTGSYKKQENSRKTSTSASLTMPTPLTVWITTNYGKFLKR